MGFEGWDKSVGRGVEERELQLRRRKNSSEYKSLWLPLWYSGGLGLILFLAIKERWGLEILTFLYGLEGLRDRIKVEFFWVFFQTEM